MTEETLLTFTEEALEALKEQLPKMGGKDRLRVAVVGGGCSGYQYLMDIQEESDKRDTDHVLEFEGITIYVDPVSAGYIKGTVIEYTFGLSGSGFQFNNPNANRKCGCGKSFS